MIKFEPKKDLLKSFMDLYEHQHFVLDDSCIFVKWYQYADCIKDPSVYIPYSSDFKLDLAGTLDDSFKERYCFDFTRSKTSDAVPFVRKVGTFTI